jgi:predicted DCC family thiol-disulfide oxidoreductase YuxK
MTTVVDRAALAVPVSQRAAAVLFIDGECGFCDRAIRFAMSRDTRGQLFASTLAGQSATQMLGPFREMLRDVDSTVLFLPATDTRAASVQVHSDAVLTVLRLLGGGWAVVGVVGLIVPRWIRDHAYKAFARRRFQLFGRVTACDVWPAEWRARMLP